MPPWLKKSVSHEQEGEQFAITHRKRTGGGEQLPEGGKSNERGGYERPAVTAGSEAVPTKKLSPELLGREFFEEYRGLQRSGC